VYVTLATSIAGGHGYRDLYLTGDPVHTKYPPVFPLLLALILAQAGPSVIVMKLAVVVMAAAALLALHRLYAELHGEPSALIVVLLTVSLHSILFYSHSVMSEMPYVLFSLLAMLAAHRCARRLPGGWLWLTAALVSLTYLTRLVGLALLPAVIAHIVIDGEGPARARWRRAIGFGALASCGAALWFARGAMLGDGAVSPYVAEFRFHDLVEAGTATGVVTEFVGRIGANLLRYEIHLGQAILHWAPRLTILMVLASSVSFVGLLRCAWRQRTILEYYVVCYLAILVVYPVNHPQRYLVPVLPFLLFYFVTGVTWLATLLLAAAGRLARGGDPVWARPGAGGIAAAVTALLLVTNGAGAVVREVMWPEAEGYHLSPGEHMYRDLALWARDHTPAGSVFVWAKPSLRYLESGRKMVRFRPGELRRNALSAILTRRVDYVVLDTFSAAMDRTVGRVVESHPEHFALVHRTETSRAYRVIGTPATVTVPRRDERS
jgi:hypothetical protein